MLNVLYNRQVRPAGTAGNATGNIDTGAPYREISRAGNMLANFGADALNKIQREQKAKELEQERAEKEAEQAQYHSQYNQGVVDYLKAENDYKLWQSQNPDTTKWESEWLKRKEQLSQSIKTKYTNPRSLTDLDNYGEVNNEHQIGAIRSERVRVDTQSAVTGYKLASQNLLDMSVNSGFDDNEATTQNAMTSAMRLHGYELTKDDDKEQDSTAITFKDYAGNTWRFKSIKDYNNPIFNDDTNRKLTAEAWLNDFNDKRGTVVKKHQAEIIKENNKVNNEWGINAFEDAASRGDVAKVNEVADMMAKHNTDIPVPVTEQRRRQYTKQAEAIIAQRAKEKEDKVFDGIQGETQMMIEAEAGLDDVYKLIDERVAKEGLSADSKRQLIEHANGYRNARIKEKTAKANSEVVAVKSVLDNVGLGKISLKTGEDYDRMIEAINKSSVLSVEQKDEAKKAMQTERSLGETYKTDYGIANNLTEKFYSAIADGKPASEIQSDLFKARYVDRNISQLDYLQISDLANKKYTPSIALGLKDTYIYGKAKIGSQERLNLFNRAMQDFVDQRIEKGDLTVQMMQQQAVIFAGQERPASIQWFAKPPSKNLPKIEPMLTADKELNEDTVSALRQEANGDEYLAMKLAREQGYKW